MSEAASAALIGALAAGVFTALGWFVMHLLSDRRERVVQRRQAALHHLQRQIEELYGPLSG
ncbi:hypothetical protein KC957_00980, partial [Candidatus Saccharibacteria bacterium]|nr:hypothetical protein [Candidatus Saccharibacteria bacterium]